MGEMSGYRCKCGHRFPDALGPLGCPNCCGDSGPACPDSQQRLRDIMQRDGLTSRSVAALVGVHPVTVRRWMSGQSRVPDAVLMVLENHYAKS